MFCKLEIVDNLQFFSLITFPRYGWRRRGSEIKRHQDFKTKGSLTKPFFSTLFGTEMDNIHFQSLV